MECASTERLETFVLRFWMHVMPWLVIEMRMPISRIMLFHRFLCSAWDSTVETSDIQARLAI